jgi:hypothetical protein
VDMVSSRPLWIIYHNPVSTRAEMRGIGWALETQIIWSEVYWLHGRVVRWLWI